MCVEESMGMCTDMRADMAAQLADSLLARGSGGAESDVVRALHLRDTQARLARFAGAFASYNMAY